MNNLKNTDAVILCGGLGKRMLKITEKVPKSMLSIKERPFLDILIDYVASFGFKRFVLCTGYKAEVIRDYYTNPANGLEIVFSNEEELLGTGGAVKNAFSAIKSDNFLVMNGDCFCRMDLRKLFEFHIEKKALVSLALIESPELEDVGFVALNNSNEIVDFSEKSKSAENGYVNAGTYFFNKEAFAYMPDSAKFSLEYDFFPSMINKGIYGYVTGGDFIDIGTPERYEKAKGMFC